MNYEKLFESDNIYYIKMNESLADDYLNMYYDMEIQKLLFKKIFTKEEIEKWINKQLADKDACRFSMIEKGTDKYIGNIEIMNKGNNIGEIFISITPRQQNKHYGTEAIRTLVDYGKNDLKLQEIELYVAKNNPKAIHCYKKIGFIEDGNSLTENDVHMTKSF